MNSPLRSSSRPLRGKLTRRLRLSLLVLLPLIALAIWLRIGGFFISPTRDTLIRFLRNPESRPELATNLSTPCQNAPFLLPSNGFIGLLWRDPQVPYSLLNGHTGIDIFGTGDPGTVPVVAAYDGYLTRLAEWKSAVIIRVPNDPLKSDRQIWLYYAHMASLDGSKSYISALFPPGTAEKPIKQGELIGYQGLYAGPNAPPIAMHLHFSIVTSEANGTFRNETRQENTLDPSLYLGLTLDVAQSPRLPVRCGG